MDRQFDDLIFKLQDPVKRHNNSSAMQGIFSSSSATPQYGVLYDSDVLSGLAKNNSSLNRNNPPNRTGNGIFLFYVTSCFVDDLKFESPLVGAGKV